MNYKAEVWNKAVSEAESVVLRATATPPGGMLKDETLPSYVTRTRHIQAEALDRWHFAVQELEKAKAEYTK